MSDPSRRLRWVLAISMFVMGGCGIIYEYVLSVLGNYLIGSSHEEIFIVIGLMMCAMGVGSFAQRLVRGNLVDRFLQLELLLGLIGGFSASMVVYLFAVSESYRVALYGLAFLLGVLIGMEIPILIRINRQYAKSLRTNLSEILSMDYAGALAGALLFTYVLLTQLSLSRISLVLGIGNVLIAGLGFLAFRDHVKAKTSLAVGLIVSLGALTFGLMQAPHWEEWAEQRFFADPIVLRETSKYQHLVMTQNAKTDVTRLYINGHLQFSSNDEFIYHECLVHPAMALARSPRRVLVLGGGDGLAVRELLRYSEVDSITLVDLDPAITRIAAEHPEIVALNEGALTDGRVEVVDPDGLTPGTLHEPTMPSQRPTQRFRVEGELPPVHVVNIDAELFLRKAVGPYDVVILDFPDPSRLEVAKLYSRSFYRTLAERLAPGGWVAVQSTSPFHAKLVFLCIGETLRSAGFSAVPYHQNVPSFGEWGFHLATLGTGQEASITRRLRSVEALKVETRFLTPELITASTHFGLHALDLPAGEPPIRPHTRLRPVLVEYHRRAWQTY